VSSGSSCWAAQAMTVPRLAALDAILRNLANL
jgi:hypothetical protein